MTFFRNFGFFLYKKCLRNSAIQDIFTTPESVLMIFIFNISHEPVCVGYEVLSRPGCPDCRRFRTFFQSGKFDVRVIQC